MHENETRFLSQSVKRAGDSLKMLPVLENRGSRVWTPQSVGGKVGEIGGGDSQRTGSHKINQAGGVSRPGIMNRKAALILLIGSRSAARISGQFLAANFA